MTDNNPSIENNGAPSWLKPVAIVAIIWNCLGLLSFSVHMLMTPEMLTALPQAEQDLMNSYPAWASVVFGVAVIFGLLGSILLLMKKAFAFECFFISIIAVIVQNYHWFVMENVLPILGASSLIMPSLVIVIGVTLLVISNKGKQQAWLN